MTIKKKNIFEWITNNFSPEITTSEEFIYNEMESQSGFSLPIIYQPFDGTKRSHWTDRGSMYDFLYATDVQGKRVLDFGPGDGWPSLLVAPYVEEVVGLDASPKRVEICSQNAERMGITNARFISYRPGSKLPFADNSFDGIMAASAVEQSPNPKEILQEFYRILKPNGKLRMSYEALNRYQDGQENELWLADLDKESSKLIIFDRNIDAEYAIQYGLTISTSREEVLKLLPEKGQFNFNIHTVPLLEKLQDQITKVQSLKTTHPSGRTYVNWLKEIGFSKTISTYNGNYAANKLYDQYSTKTRPTDLESIDRIIQQTVSVVINLEAPIEKDMMITAVK